MSEPAPDLAPFRRLTEHFVSEAELTARLARGRPLRIKYGNDPSAPDLHLGHFVILERLRAFQELGHTVVFLVGDFTARIGDPSGRSKTRPMLSEEQVRSNAETYRAQVGAVLDARRIEVRFNSEWMDRMSPADFIRLAAQQPVARMLERDDFRRRHESGVSIGIHEFLYPLVQAYDSVALRADIEVGGSDQLFNLLLGREIQRAHGQEPQIALAYPLLRGMDGVEKMSKSLGNAIGIREAPEQIYGKVMAISDAMLDDWIRLLGPAEASACFDAEVAPQNRKAALARYLVGRLHGESAAAGAEEHFDRVFRRGEIPESIQEVTLSAREGGSLVSVLVRAGLAASSSEAKRLISQGGVSLDRERIEDLQQRMPPGEHVLQVGKRRFLRVRLEP